MGEDPRLGAVSRAGQIGHIARDCRRQRGDDQGAPPHTSVVTVAVIRPNVAVTWRRMGRVVMEVMLDSGSSVSLIRQKILSRMQGIIKIQADVTSLRLVTASGDQLPMLDHIRASVILSELKVSTILWLWRAWSAQ